MEPVLFILIGVGAVVFALLGGITLIVTAAYKGEVAKQALLQVERIKQLEFAQEARLKALEHGQMPVEVQLVEAQAHAARVRGEVARQVLTSVARLAVPLVVPVGLAGIGVGATAIILHRVESSMHVACLGIVWLAVGIIGVAAVASGLMESQRLDLRSMFRKPADKVTTYRKDPLLEAIQE